jgi:hypothetical protein
MPWRASAFHLVIGFSDEPTLAEVRKYVEDRSRTGWLRKLAMMGVADRMHNPGPWLETLRD